MLSKGKIPVILRKTKVSGTEWLNLRHVCISHSIISDSLRPYGLWPPRLLCPWDSAGKNTGVVCHFLLQGIFPTQGSNLGLLHYRQILYHLSHVLLLLSCFSRVWLFEAPWTIAPQAPLSMEFSRQEYWSGLPFPSPEDLPIPGVELGSPALQADSLLFEPPTRDHNKNNDNEKV